MNFYAINVAPINGDAGQIYYGESNAYLVLQADANLKQATTASVTANALLTANAKSGRAIYANGSALLSLSAQNTAHHVQNYNQGKAGLVLNNSGKSSVVLFGFGVGALNLNSKNTSHHVNTKGSGKSNLILNGSAKSGLALFAKANADLSLGSLNTKHHVNTYGETEAYMFIMALANYANLVFGNGRANSSLNANNPKPLIHQYAKGLSSLTLESNATSSLRHSGLGIAELGLNGIANYLSTLTGSGKASNVLSASGTNYIEIYSKAIANNRLNANAHLSIILYEHGLVEISLNAKSSGKIAMLGSVESLFELMAKDGIPNPPIAPIWFNDAHRSARLKEPTENRSFVVPKDRGKMTVTDNQSIRIQRE